MSEQLGKKGCEVAADEARSTSEGQEATWHTHGRVLVAVANHLISVVDASGGKVQGFESNECREAQVEG